MDLQQLLRNRDRFPPEELAKYAGKYVAWSPDGTQIVASDENEQHLDQMVRTAGYEPGEILVSFIPSPDEVVLGGAGDPA